MTSPIVQYLITHWQPIAMAILMAALVVILLIVAIDAQEGGDE